MDENGEEKLFSVTQKEFGAKERKQNKKLVDAQKNAQMQAGRASKAQAKGIEVQNNTLYNALYGSYTVGMIARSGQANTVAMDMRDSEVPVIVCGDFNDVPYSYVYNTMLGDKVDGFKECGSGFMHTFRGGKKMVRIDYIFHDKALEGLSYYKKDLSYSDHYPVFMRIATKQ
jgi:endonuclease/exonuclease/phosphatase family metal-dependent hydrolase